MTMHFDPASFVSQAEANGFDVGQHANFLAALEASITEHYAKAKGASRATLEALRDVGEHLNDAKETLQGTGQGAFGKWCDAYRFPFTREWWARLMKLATHWDEIVAILEAQPDDRKAWSLDGALGLLRAAEKARQEAERGDAGEKFGADEEPAPKAKKETEAERLRRALAEAVERIKQLESVIMAMQQGSGTGEAGSAQA